MTTTGSRCAAYLDDNYIHPQGRRTTKEVNLLWRERFYGPHVNGVSTELGA